MTAKKAHVIQDVGEWIRELNVGDLVFLRSATGEWIPGIVASITATGLAPPTYQIIADKDGIKESGVIRERIQHRTGEFIEGNLVEANWQNYGRYYPGKISKVESDTTYSIDYDDGDKEQHVPALLIRHGYSVNLIAAGELKVGDRVLGSWKGRGAWHLGKIISVNESSNTYEIAYDDGNHEVDVSLNRIKYPDSPLTPGQRMMGNQKGLGHYYACSILRINVDSSYLVAYENGDFEDLVPASRLINCTIYSAVISNRMSSGILQVGNKIEANWEYHGEWHSGMIEKVNENDQYDVVYDDGRREEMIGLDRIRYPKREFKKGQKVIVNGFDSGICPGIIHQMNANGSYNIVYDNGDLESNVFSDRIQSNENENIVVNTEAQKVTANWKGLGTYYPGIITKDLGNNNYNIAYDDGDLESAVPQDRIQRLNETQRCLIQ